MLALPALTQALPAAAPIAKSAANLGVQTGLRVAPRLTPTLATASYRAAHPLLIHARKYMTALAKKKVQTQLKTRILRSAPTRRGYATSLPPRAGGPYNVAPPQANGSERLAMFEQERALEFAKAESEGSKTAHASYGSRLNTIVNICPQQEMWIVERFGKFLESVGGGMHFYVPFIDRIAYRFSMKEQALLIPSRSAITKDNVRIHCIGVLYFKIIDPVAAAYGCGDPVFALSQLAQTSLRSVIGKLTLDETFHERNLVNLRVVETCNDASKVWGITCLRHEIREIQPPDNVLHAMEMQMEAERKKRVDILKSEGEQQAAVNRAEAAKREVILASEAQKAKTINLAEGDAQSILLRAEASRDSQILSAEGAAQALERLGQATAASGGENAVQFQLAQKYIEALASMAKTNNTMIVPANVADISSMLAQATSVVSQIGAKTAGGPSVAQQIASKAESSL